MPNQTNADIVVGTKDKARHRSCWMEHGRPATWEMKKLLYLGTSHKLNGWLHGLICLG